MNLGVFARIFEPRPVEQIFSTVSAMGYTSVQFNLSCVGLPMLPVEPVPRAVMREIEQTATRYGVSIPAISGTFNMIHPDRAVVDAGLRGLQVLGDVCRALKIPVITLCTGTRDPENMWREHPDNGSAAAWRDLVETMKRALDLTGEGVSLAIEPEPANVVNSAPRASRLCAEIGSGRLGVTLDAANLIKGLSAAEDRRIFDQAFELLGDRVLLAHAKEKKTDGTVCPAGQGVVDFPYFIRGLTALSYTGSLIAHGFDEKDAGGVAAYLNPLLQSRGRSVG